MLRSKIFLIVSMNTDNTLDDFFFSLEHNILMSELTDLSKANR